MTINTRPAIAEDTDWLADVFIHSMRDAITFVRGSWDFGREDAQFRAQLQLSDTRVIQMEGDDVGFVIVRILGMKSLELHTLCIKPDRQGLGIGTRTVQDIMMAAQTADSTIELSVLKSNSRAAHFYARLGFSKIGIMTHHIRMRWPITVEGQRQAWA